jgi:CHAT domain-containing protein/tetratricopeptide (TPR) repeat protein
MASNRKTSQWTTKYRWCGYALPGGARLSVGVLVMVSALGAGRPLPRASVQQQTAPIQNNSGQAEPDIRPLAPGKLIERELGVGQAHAYAITLAAGQFIQIVVEQKGVNVALTLLATDGTQAAETNLTTSLGRESLSYEAAAAGVYRLMVRAVAPTAPTGTYALRIDLRDVATAADKQRLRAERLLTEGVNLAAKRGAGLQSAIDSFQQAVTLWREIRDRYWEAYTLYRIGVANFSLSRYEPARDYFSQTLAIRKEIKDRAGEGSALTALGNVCGALSRYQEAIEYFDQALPIRRELKDRDGEEATLNNLANTYRFLSRFEKAIGYYEQSLVISREMKDRINEGAILNNLGGAHESLGRHETALDYYEKALVISREVKDRAGEEARLGNLALVYNRLSRSEEAVQYLRQALAITREVKDRVNEGIVFSNLGQAHIRLGQYEQAAGYYEQGLAIRREVKDRAGEGLALSGLGEAYYLLKRYEEALACDQQAVVIARDVKNLTGEGTALTDLGIVYRQLNRYQEAVESFSRALAIVRETKDPGQEETALHQFAILERDQGNLAHARELIEESLRVAESTRAGFYSQQLRAFYSASVQDSHQFYVDLLMRINDNRPAGGTADDYVGLALQANERSRARTLLELLAEARADIRQGVDPSLLEQERDLKRQLDAEADSRTRLLSRPHSAEQIAALDREINGREDEFQRLQAAIRRRSPHYAALTQPQPLGVPEIQQTLDGDTILLEYALGEERSYLFALTPTSLSSWRLPPRTEIEAGARKLYRLLTARQPRDGETDVQRRARDAEADAKYRAEAAALSKVLLGPVAAQLGSKRLLIVAPGALEYVPFTVLPEPVDSRSPAGNAGTPSPEPPETDPKPLIVKHEIVFLPSASVLAALRTETSGRLPNARSVAVLADPVFSGNDPRVRRGTARSNPTPVSPSSKQGSQEAFSNRSIDLEHAVRVVRGSAGGSLPRLPFSRQEAEAIASTTSDRSVLMALDFDANRNTATAGDLGQYRVVHFATHGLLDTEHPELSGLVFSLVDRAGRPQDGFLRLHDIYNMHLPVEVVVLSACQTGLGREIQGEGLMGLTRGFMYAGAERVVASMWQVDDVATSELMKRFYHGMFKAGMTPAAALRAAQVDLLSHKQWQAPYYWGAFVLQGEWR